MVLRTTEAETHVKFNNTHSRHSSQNCRHTHRRTEIFSSTTEAETHVEINNTHTGIHHRIADTLTDEQHIHTRKLHVSAHALTEEQHIHTNTHKPHTHEKYIHSQPRIRIYINSERRVSDSQNLVR